MTIEEYIQKQPKEIQPQLRKVYEAIGKELPQAEERISWGMPTWKGHHNIIHFAPAKRHIGIYPGSEAVEHFAGELRKRGYSFDKGTIRIPYGEDLPLELIGRIAAWCGKEDKKLDAK